MILLNERCPKKEIRVDPGGQLADIARPHQELVARDLGVRRGLRAE